MVISQLRQQLADKLRHMGCDAPGLESAEAAIGAGFSSLIDEK